MGIKRIVITGGPGTGKTSIIEELSRRNFKCLEEISRQVTLEAQKNGVDQLFLSDPLKFSDLLLEGRMKQFEEAGKFENPLVFLDRGIPDVLAYLNFAGQGFPNHYKEACSKNIYDMVFVLGPWQEIYQSDNERYESFEQAVEIHHYLEKTYSSFNYDLVDVPFGSVESRTEFILDITAALQ